MNNTKESCTAFYGWSKDNTIRMDSSSGGFFSVLAGYVLDHDGVVIGAYFDAETKSVKHASSDVILMDQMRKSKYVESDMTKAIPLIQEAVSKKRLVLFCGTPCQCAGIRMRFGGTEDIILCDFFCHGVPSPRVFKDFLEWKEKKANSSILDYQFRTKEFGWTQYGVKTIFRNGKTEDTVGRCEFQFTASMLNNDFLRECCYTCDKAMYHSADFTIGDFWGVNQIQRPQNWNRGISAIIVNTAYAEKILSEIRQNLELFPLPKTLLKYAFRVKTDDKLIEGKKKKYEEYKKIGIEEYINKYYKTRLMLSRILFAVKKHKFKRRCEGE